MKNTQLKNFLGKLRVALQDENSWGAEMIRNKLICIANDDFRKEYDLDENYIEKLINFEGDIVFEFAAKCIIHDALYSPCRARAIKSRFFKEDFLEDADFKNLLISDEKKARLFRERLVTADFLEDADFKNLLISDEIKALREKYMVNGNIKEGYGFALKDDRTFTEIANEIVLNDMRNEKPVTIKRENKQLTLKDILGKLRVALQDENSEEAKEIRSSLISIIGPDRWHGTGAKEAQDLLIERVGSDKSLIDKLYSSEKDIVFEYAAKCIISDILQHDAYDQGLHLSKQISRNFLTWPEGYIFHRSPEAKALREKYMTDGKIKRGYTFTGIADEIVLNDMRDERPAPAPINKPTYKPTLKNFLGKLKVTLQDENSKKAEMIRSRLIDIITYHGYQKESKEAQNVLIGRVGSDKSLIDKLKSGDSNIVFECAAKCIISDILDNSQKVHLSRNISTVFSTWPEEYILDNSPEAKALREKYMTDGKIKEGYTFTGIADEIVLNDMRNEEKIKEEVIRIFNESQNNEEFVSKLKGSVETDIAFDDCNKVYNIIQKVCNKSSQINKRDIDKFLESKTFIEWLSEVLNVNLKKYFKVTEEYINNKNTFQDFIMTRSSSQQIKH